MSPKSQNHQLRREPKLTKASDPVSIGERAGFAR
jgi:hypothetical protein